MERTKPVTYQSCDLCENPEETGTKCDICGKYLCHEHQHRYLWGDQEYFFCANHFDLVRSIIEETRIPIGFVVSKLSGRALGSYMEKQFVEAGYSELWKEEWVPQV